MKILTGLKNCQGIKALRYEFDFGTGNAFSVYAPDGAMKTSHAKVFADISGGIRAGRLRILTYSGIKVLKSIAATGMWRNWFFGGSV